MYFVHAPFFLRWYYSHVTWNRSRHEKDLYLTFDDGPIPEITPWILDLLAELNVKATFFCVGENIEKYPTLFARIVADGHQIGNHTYSHIKGWDCTTSEYLENVSRCQKLTKTKLFRPPYARATKTQIAALKDDFELVYWDVLSGDFDLGLTPQKCYENVIKYSKNGSIIVFHDNVKAIPRLQYALPKAIKYLLQQGYRFKLL